MTAESDLTLDDLYNTFGNVKTEHNLTSIYDTFANRHSTRRVDTPHPPPQQQDPGEIHPYAKAAITEELGRLKALPRPWREGANWDTTTYEVACNLIEIANSPWSGYTLEAAAQDLMRHAPADDQWGMREHEQKWNSASKMIGNQGRPEPPPLNMDAPPVTTLPTAGANGQMDPSNFNIDVQRELYRLQVNEAARTMFRQSQEPDLPPFDIGTLGEILERPQDPPDRVEGLIKSEGSTLITAQRKTGKTTFTLNLAKALITGEEFLGRFPTRRVTGNIALLNFEVSGHLVARWADAVGIDPTRLTLVNLRGRRNPFATEADKDHLGQLLRNRDIETIIVDPFGRAFSGESQNDNGEVTKWLMGLDEFTRSTVGAKDLILAAHAGWEGERTRGASALEDWPDSIIWLRRGETEDDPTRYLRAEGRDVDVEEDALAYDPATHILTLTGTGSRRQASQRVAIQRIMPEVLQYIEDNPGASKNAIETDVKGRRDNVRAALQRCIDSGNVEQKKEGQALKHYRKEPTSPTSPQPRPGRTNLTSPPRLYRGEGEVKGEGEETTKGEGEPTDTTWRGSDR